MSGIPVAIVLGWLLWAAAVVIILSFISYLRAQEENAIHILQVFQGVLMIGSLILFIFMPWNKFHLIWAMLASFLGGFLGFALFPIPVIGTFLRLVTLAFPRAFFLGTGADITGVPLGCRFASGT
jgi:hypothetical protein